MSGGPGFHVEDEDILLADAARRAFAGAGPATAQVDGLGLLAPIGADMPLVTATIAVREAARAGLDYPLAATLCRATVLGEGGEAAAFASTFAIRGTGGRLKAPAHDGTKWVLVAEAAGTRLVEIDAPERPATDPLQGAPWVDVPDGGTGYDLDIRPIARILLSAAILGAGESLLNRTVDHLTTREQFGRPLGSFQSLRHRAAADWMALEDIRAATDLAAVAFDAGETHEAAALARIAKATAADHGPRLAENAIHAHGAMGFTHDAGLGPYLTAIRHAAVTMGGPELFQEIGRDRMMQNRQEPAA